MVHATSVDGLRGGRLRVGMVGGGRNAFIGAVHRMAMRLDDMIELPNVSGKPMLQHALSCALIETADVFAIPFCVLT